MGGMGGDRGINQAKLFNVSTLSSLTLSCINGFSVHKHHSLGNTSPVGGQNFLDAIQASSSQNTPESLEYILEKSNLVMSSAHTMRTLHTLSHLLRGETINHLIGPLSVPIQSEYNVNGVFEVNHNVHPQTLLDALNILQERGIQNYDTNLAFCGLSLNASQTSKIPNTNEYYDSSKCYKSQVAFDEVAPPPYATMVGFQKSGNFLGTYLLDPQEILTRSELEQATIELIKDKSQVLEANQRAIGEIVTGEMIYLAYASALSIFSVKYLDTEALKNGRIDPQLFRCAYEEAFDVLHEGKVRENQRRFVKATQDSLRYNLEC